MIHYELRCAGGHAFDGWFAGSEAFDRQCAAGQVECPQCGGSEVGRAMMAPAVGRTKVSMPPPAQLVAALQRLRAEVERNCEHVGAAFADQAQRMHRGELALRAIYGEATLDQAEELRDEGIEIQCIPWVNPADC